MKRLFLIIIIIFTHGSIALADSGRLYGTVVTTEGKEITGAIRWDDEEVFWTDHFNGKKAEPSISATPQLNSSSCSAATAWSLRISQLSSDPSPR
jgi:hypothetical protein